MDLVVAVEAPRGDRGIFAKGVTTWSGVADAIHSNDSTRINECCTVNIPLLL